MTTIYNIKNIVINIEDRIKLLISRKIEIEKFKDKRRKSIYKNIYLSKNQKKEIDNLYLKNYGKKIPYIWHKHYTAFTGKFDKKYFPELLYIPEFEKYENINIEYCKVLQDKNFIPLIAKSCNIKTPKMYINRTSDVLRNAKNEKISKEEAIKLLITNKNVFCKPSIGSSSGRGCLLTKIRDENDANYILNYYNNDFIVQECLECNKNISKIYSNSVNTFRIITYRWNDNILHMPLIMRIGRGGKYLDNAHAGGIFIAVEDDGYLHSTAFTEFNEKFTIHPDTGVVFDGYKIDNMKKVIDAAIKMHYSIPQIGCINWDFTIDVKGEAVLIEANVLGGSIWLIEMAWGKGAFGDNTEEVLKWLKLMRQTPKVNRKKYLFGKMN